GVQVVGPSQPVKATVGEDVLLSCRLKPAADASDMSVEWSRDDLDPRFVFVCRSPKSRRQRIRKKLMFIKKHKLLNEKQKMETELQIVEQKLQTVKVQLIILNIILLSSDIRISTLTVSLVLFCSDY
ncbi:butyrophilin subfamily 2 member A1-like, partial [Stegastes partitus]|uniref:Butyrophilin subfamily 2 member A1-like n=1 Tax=Stegastes partitus TaxID=144197 RepID=A0A9Y4NVI4_9TELE